MSSTTADEKPRKEIAKQVITPKRKYFLPSTGATIEGETLEDAVAKTKKQPKQTKAGDEQ